jgi:hypothetical protein
MDMACYFGQFEVLQYLVKRQGYHQGLTLHHAAQKARLEIVDYCIAQGANIELRSKKKGEGVLRRCITP